MHHKRKRPKHRRSGCLICKPHKDERQLKKIKIRGIKSEIDLKTIDTSE